MKKAYLNNIITISLIAAFLFSVNFGNSVYCESNDCCKTECCAESSAAEESEADLFFDKTECCEFSQTFIKEKMVVTSFIKNINLLYLKSLNHYVTDLGKQSNITTETSFSHKRNIHSITILRI